MTFEIQKHCRTNKTFQNNSMTIKKNHVNHSVQISVGHIGSDVTEMSTLCHLTWTKTKCAIVKWSTMKINKSHHKKSSYSKWCVVIIQNKFWKFNKQNAWKTNANHQVYNIVKCFPKWFAIAFLSSQAWPTACLCVRACGMSVGVRVCAYLVHVPHVPAIVSLRWCCGITLKSDSDVWRC